MTSGDEPTLYRNAGNEAVLALVPKSASRVLDVGCGAGDNARLLRARGHEIWGVTLSEDEAKLARQSMVEVWVGTAEELIPSTPRGFFDLLLMSHVLEHFAQPTEILRRFGPYLRPEGLLVAAVPNMAHWRVRLRILAGDWTRENTGPFDRTHLQFWSVATAATILQDTPFELLAAKGGSPSAPLRPLRRVSKSVAARLDQALGSAAPNLFAQQILLSAVYRP